MNENIIADRPSDASIQKLSDMIAIALEDGILTDDEKNLLCGMAKTLGIEKCEMEALLDARLEERSISQLNSEIEWPTEPAKQSFAKRFAFSLGNAVSKNIENAFGPDRCSTIIKKQTSDLDGFVSGLVSLVRNNSQFTDQQQAHVKTQIDALLTKVRERHEQSKLANENKKQEFAVHSVRFVAIGRQITDIEHARNKRHSLLKNSKDSTVAENESKNIEIEESSLLSLKEEILAIPVLHAKRLEISKTLKRIDRLARTTIFDETKEEKTEKILMAARELAGATIRGLGTMAAEAAKNEAIQKAVFDKGVAVLENRKKK